MRLRIRSVFSFLAAAALMALPAHGEPPSRAQAIADAITELDVDAAQKLLEKTDASSPTLRFERARLAIYEGDCDTASAILSAPDFSSTPEGASLGDLAKSCARATAGSLVVEDKGAGIWIRLQDQADEVLVPYIVDVASRAREQVQKDLGVTLPRPLRIDLVRDLFTLSAISGLPVAAAETTGTVAVARWGRVTMLSPRATLLGYPWEDTMAHEITHLALSRATRDHAPLWLQEGIAKRQETRWRAPRPFDREPSADLIAKNALVTGRSVGVDKLGPSIAMLPSPEAASIAFSEVTSFMAYFIRTFGDGALRLLLADLKGLGVEETSAALRSVSGYDLSGLIIMWQHTLLGLPPGDAAEYHAELPKGVKPDDVLRAVRLGDLLFARGHAPESAEEFAPAVRALGGDAALRFRGARSLLASDQHDAAVAALGTLADVHVVHGGWQALSGRLLAESGDAKAADSAFERGIAVDPLSEDVACEGRPRPRAAGKPEPPLPRDARRRALCEAARAAPRD
jgi:Peptidase MA superfamily